MAASTTRSKAAVIACCPSGPLSEPLLQERLLVNPAEFSKLTDLLPEPVLLVSGDGTVLASNRSFARQICGDALGRNLGDLVCESAARVGEYLRSCGRGGGSRPGAFSFQNAGQKIRWRVEGGLIAPHAEPEHRRLMLRLLSQQVAVQQFTALGQKIRQLGEEVSRRKQAEDELLEQQEYLHTTLHSIGDAVIVTDADGRVSTMNPVAEELTGWGAEAVGEPLVRVFRIFNETTGAVVENPVERVLREGVVVGLANHTNLLSKDGVSRPIADSAAPIRNASGELTGVVLVFRDVTVERGAERTLREESRITAALNRLSGVLHSELDLDRLLQAITDESTSLTGAEFGAFFYNVVDPRHDSYMLYTLSGAARERFAGIPMPRATAVVGPTFRGGGVVRLDDVTKDPRYAHNAPFHGLPPDHPPVRSYLAAPVVARSGEVIGGLFFGHSHIGIFTEREEQLVVGVAAQAAIAIDNARLYQAAQESEQHFRQLADSMPQIVWTARADGQVDYFNRRWFEAYSFSNPHGPVSGDDDWPRVIHPEDLQRTLDAWNTAVRTGELYEIQYRFRDRHTGAYRWHLGRGLPIRNDAGEIVRWYGTSTDIEEQKRVEHTSRFLAYASNELSNLSDYETTLQRVARLAVPDFADWCVVDMVEPDGSLRRLAVTHADPEKLAAIEELQKRYPPHESGATPVQRVARTGESELYSEIPPSVLQDRAHDAEHLRLLNDLGLRSMMAVPIILHGGVLGVISFVMAESPHRYGPHDLTIAEDLARRAAVAIDNARLYGELKTADRRKNEFLAMLAHELRNPLAPIRSGLDLLTLEGNSGETVSLMMSQVEHLVRLVDDLLDLSRIMQGKIQLRTEPVDLQTILQRAIGMTRGAIDSKQHRLHFESPEEALWIEADPVRLTQVFANLLNNSAKYTDPPGDIWLTIRRDGDTAVIDVRDNGTGIDAQLLPHVFELFTQADRSLDRAQGGLGIGLTLVQTLVAMHGGTVAARSEGVGQGSQFTVTLPALVTPPPRAATSSSQSGASIARRILIVDDTPAAAKMLRLVLAKLGPYEVDVVHDGPAALVVAEQMQPEIIFLDIGLPRMDGSEVARRLRTRPQFANTLLVALTGYGQEEDRRRTAEAGFDVHLVKPASLEVISQVLNHPRLAASG